MEAIIPHIESLIFAADRPLATDEIQDCIEQSFEAIVPLNDIEEAIAAITHKYEHADFSFSLVEIAGGYQFLTKPAFHAPIDTFLRQASKKRLSAAALETLAIIAYRQPITRTEVESIRGVNCDYAIQKLLDKELIAIAGRSETVGKPLLYTTSQKFMDYFGLKNMQDLPRLKDFKAPEEEIGEAPSIDDVVDNLRTGRRAIAEVDENTSWSPNQNSDQVVLSSKEEE